MIGKNNKNLKMLESILENMFEEDNDGIRLIRKGKYNQAIDYFKSRLDSRDYLTYYGLATAMFKKKKIELTEEEIQEIINLYKKSIRRKPDFADAYLMHGMAYEQLASVLIKEYKKDPYTNPEKKMQKINQILSQAKKNIKRSVELNPQFEEITKSELDVHERRIRGLRFLREYYDKNKHLFN